MSELANLSASFQGLTEINLAVFNAVDPTVYASLKKGNTIQFQPQYKDKQFGNLIQKEKPLCAPNLQQYERPKQSKLFCPFCNDHVDGFRGEHELQRHVNRAHMQGRKVWICIDASTDGKWLENCKACRTQKRYGAYYNAAAHLRRAHFNPRKRGRKARNEAEKRGGRGPGNWPPMEQLKEHWMREVEDDVNETSGLLSDNINGVGEEVGFCNEAAKFVADNSLDNSGAVVIAENFGFSGPSEVSGLLDGNVGDADEKVEFCNEDVKLDASISLENSGNVVTAKDFDFDDPIKKAVDYLFEPELISSDQPKSGD